MRINLTLCTIPVTVCEDFVSAFFDFVWLVRVASCFGFCADP